MKSPVYFADLRARSDKESTVAKVQRLFDAAVLDHVYVTMTARQSNCILANWGMIPTSTRCLCARLWKRSKLPEHCRL